MKWTIDPFIGVGPLKFSMTPADAEAILGPPRNIIDRSNGYVNYSYHDRSLPVLGVQDGKLADITFSRWTDALHFDGLDYFQTKPSEFLDRVRLRDPDVKRNVLGEITSFALGIAFDITELGESDKTIMAFARSEIEAYQKFGPFTPA